MTLWQARMGSEPAADMLAFSSSLSFDRRLAQCDVTGSLAHVEGLRRAGIISGEEADALRSALEVVASEIDRGSFDYGPDDEDIHTAVERRVTELAGEAGAKLHTGRSRNDQVATDLRLYARRGLVVVGEGLVHLGEVLLKRSEEAGEAYLPGYTHLQRAQPVLLSHHLMAHAWALARDVDRCFATRARADVSPLGAGALAGSSLALEPATVAGELGFSACFENSLDAVSDRDFVAESLFDLAMVGLHLSRLGEEIVLWSTDEFGFLSLDDAWATGSSMLPQKKNPDVAELARGKAGRLVGDLCSVLVTLKGLPLSYNRDLQEATEPLMDGFDQVNGALRAMAGLLETARFEIGAMREAADAPGAAAVDLAEWLVGSGMPFRRAHALVGALVRESLERKVPLSELVEAHPDLGADAAALLVPGVAVTRRTSPGAAGPDAVAIQMQRYRERLEADRARVRAAQVR